MQLVDISSTRAIPEVSGLDILENNILYKLYISETHIFYWLMQICYGYDVIVIYDVIEH